MVGSGSVMVFLLDPRVHDSVAISIEHSVMGRSGIGTPFECSHAGARVEERVHPSPDKEIRKR